MSHPPAPHTPAPPLSGIELAVPITILLSIIWLLATFIDAVSKSPH